MAFNILQVRSAADVATADHPTPAADANTVELSPGEAILEQFSVSMVISSTHDSAGWHAQTRLPDVEGVGYLTDRRIALACSRFDGKARVGFSLGGLALAGAVAAVERLRQSAASARPVLVGHVLHEQLGAVKAQDRSGILKPNLIEFVVRAPDQTIASLLLHLDKRTSASALAERVVAVACARQAASASDDAREALRAYGQQPTYKTLANGYRAYQLPR